MPLVLAKRMRLRIADFQGILRPNMFLNQKSALCGRILFASTEVMHTYRSGLPLYFGIKNIYQFFPPNIRVASEPGHPTPGRSTRCFHKAQNCPEIPISGFFQVWVDPAPPTFQKFRFSLDKTGKKKEKKK